MHNPELTCMEIEMGQGDIWRIKHLMTNGRPTGHESNRVVKSQIGSLLRKWLLVIPVYST